MLRLGSLFSGIGGFEFTAQLVNIKPVWASEIVPECVGVTKRHFPEIQHLGDITKLNGADIEPVDIITFGSPCTDISNAGKRAGLVDGKQSSLFFEAIRIVKEMRGVTNGKYPRFIVWENVFGAFSTNRGEDFQRVIQEISSIANEKISIPRPSRKPTGELIWEPAGAIMGDSWTLAWRVMDAQYFGVPQRRRRIFLVADFRGKRAGEILFKPDSLPGDFAESREQKERITEDTKKRSGNANKKQYAVDFGRVGDRIQMNVDKAVTLQSGGGGGAGKTGLYCLPTYYCQQRNDEYKKSDVSKTLASRDYKSPTDLINYGYAVRRLTPLECERLQGIPDKWTEYDVNGKKISDSARYKALGNSVAIPCVLRVLSAIKDVYEE